MTRMRTPKTLALPLLATSLAAGCTEEEAGALPEDLAQADEGDAEVEVDAEVGDLAAIAPPPGTSVWSERLLADGTTQQYVLHTTPEGEVVLEELVDDRISAGPPEATEVQSACSDDAYILTGWRWETRLRWSFHAGTTPDELSADAAETALAAATSNITAAHNGCGLADEVGASHEYLGRKSEAANIDDSGDCLASDGASAVSFGDLPAGTLATACVWFKDGVAKEGDVKLNKADYTWTTDPGAGCSKRWSLQAVMTHERGHTFGLGHVGEAAHGDLTMSPQINGPCQDSESTLGEGDIAGLRALY